MATQRDQVFRDALRLETPERAELLERLIDSLDLGTEAGVDEAWMQEVERRAAEIDSGAVAMEPWEVLRKRLRSSEDR